MDRPILICVHDHTCAGLRHKELNTSADYVYMFTAALRDAEILCESRPKQILDEFLSC